MFIGRNKEIGELNDRYYTNVKQFGLVYGRRRIGKSTLIKEFCKDKESLYFQAKKDNAYGNRRSLSYAINKVINSPNLNYVYQSYEEIFDVLKKYVQDRRFIFVIDEYPYIVEQDASFSSIVQEFIDNAPDNFFVIISSSDISFLQKEVINHASPLYKRKTFEINVKKLPFIENKLFLSSFNNEEKAKFLSIFSSSPYYLSVIDPKNDFDSTLINTLFNEFGIFYNLPDQVLSNSTKCQDVYNSILYAIAHHYETIKDISDYIHEKDAKVAKYLTTLISSGVVDRLDTYMGNKKTSYYAISDALLQFWYLFIFDNQDRIAFNGKMVFEELKEKIHLFVSEKFENICNSYLDYLNEQGELKEIFSPVKRYRVDKSQIGRSIEIDGLASSSKTLLVVECKFRNIPFTYTMFEHLQESVSIFPQKLKRLYYIFSKSGFDDKIRNLQHENLHLIDLDTMMSLKK